MLLDNVDFAVDVDSLIALIMAVIFAAGLWTMFLPSSKANGLKPYLAAMLLTAIALFLASATWLLIDDVLMSPWTATLIWVRVVTRIANFIATLAFVYRVVRYESPI